MRNVGEARGDKPGSRTLIPKASLLWALTVLVLAIPALATASTWASSIWAERSGDYYYVYAAVSSDNWWAEWSHTTGAVSYNDHTYKVYDDGGTNHTQGSWTVSIGRVPADDDRRTGSATVWVVDNHGNRNSKTWNEWQE